MNIERKYKIQLRQIEKLEQTIERLQEENAVLTSEKLALQAKLETCESIIKNIKFIESDYQKGIKEAKEIKEKYEQLVKDVHESKNKYSAKMKKLLKNFRNKFRLK